MALPVKPPTSGNFSGDRSRRMSVPPPQFASGAVHCVPSMNTFDPKLVMPGSTPAPSSTSANTTGKNPFDFSILRDLKQQIPPVGQVVEEHHGTSESTKVSSYPLQRSAGPSVVFTDTESAPPAATEDAGKGSQVAKPVHGSHSPPPQATAPVGDSESVPKHTSTKGEENDLQEGGPTKSRGDVGPKEDADSEAYQTAGSVSKGKGVKGVNRNGCPPSDVQMDSADTDSVNSLCKVSSPTKTCSQLVPGTISREVQSRVLHQCILDSICGRAIGDLTILANSRRSVSGSPYHPKALVFPSRLLIETSPVFESLLSDRSVELGDYDVDSDYDDDDEETLNRTTQVETATQPIGEIESDNEDDGWKTPSSIGFASHTDEDNNSRSIQSKVKTPVTKSSPHDTEISTNARKVEATIIQGGAYKTWMALFYYLLTGKIVFSLRSQASPGNNTASGSEEDNFTCSPKSMYRLAHKLKIQELQAWSYHNLLLKINGHNIVKELFSDFTWRYPDILDAQIEKYYKFCDQDIVRADMEKVIDRIAEGQLQPHFAAVWRALNRKLVQTKTGRVD